ncbi:50S ribosomal protein L9 [Candidatus Kaiserbacteria bacterium CG10_big_fil_rev_8_21_14_0_10_56_12]|uniref:Large ribosomal subunit protein bL9 n=1 Tax=Candidatus Kaiserbacteria bacterium CG10_big_fil_rev_8_21_14_0_10_56_12 TaxID=1974611 RepID=A0A2H0UAC7_9BACT|nr:MAG: 50S ribosomal protein L9 [Candidatus Kaiserbacteria bacterium CG10_big_fil_rev_8_21_14_0_10_56_12]
MKIILTKDVKGVGRKHETVDAADGYALNYLIPSKSAIPATAGAMNNAAAHLKRDMDRRAMDTKLLAQNFSSLADANITITAKANDKGHLYDAVGAKEIAAAAKEQASVDLPAHAITIEKPFKELGTFEIPLSAGELFGKFSITIASE